MADKELNGEKSRIGVTIENINLSFGRSHILKNISLKIKPGEFFAFLGPSGCGKTTLLRLIAGFESPQTGRVLIGDEDVSQLPPWKRNVGMVFQNYALWPHLSVRKNVAFGLEERKYPRPEINQRVRTVLKLVDLLEFSDRRPSQLSGGQQQRVALARTIVVEPRVLLLDEPLSNLDAKLRIQMRQELLALQRKLSLTTIFVTHDQEEANTTADRIAVIDAGIVQQIGTPMELYDHPANLFVATFLGTANVMEGEIRENTGRTAFHASDGLIVPLKKAANGKCSVVIRPQNFTLLTEDSAPIPGALQLRGTVRHMEFLGHVTRYTIAVNQHIFLVDDAHQAGQKVYRQGAKVNFYLNTDQIIAIPTARPGRNEVQDDGTL